MIKGQKFSALDQSLKITLAKEKEGRKRKSDRGGRKEEKRKKTMDAILVLTMATLKKKNIV